MSPTIRPDEPPVELDDVRAGRLPERYGYRMQDVFLERLDPLLVDGVRILDVGAGRSPTIAPERRPANSTYIGLDVSAEELNSAPPGAYDDIIVTDISRPTEVDSQFDLILSWQVLEHVPNLQAAFTNLHAMLAPGGVLLAQTSGSRAVFAVGAGLVPHPVRVWAMERFLGHAGEEKFPTRYDRCTHAAITSMLSTWSQVDVVCFYRAAPYLSMSRPLQRLYLRYEDAIDRRGARNLATHYLIVARR